MNWIWSKLSKYISDLINRKTSNTLLTIKYKWVKWCLRELQSGKGKYISPDKKKNTLPKTFICIPKQVLQQHHTSYTYMVQTSKISFQTTYSVLRSTVINNLTCAPFGQVSTQRFICFMGGKVCLIKIFKQVWTQVARLTIKIDLIIL